MISDFLNCRSGKIDITPVFPTRLGGYARRTAVFDGVADNLEANLIILSQGNNNLFLFSLDIFYVSDELKADLIKAVAKYVEIHPSQLMMAASHTHFAPTVEKTRVGIGLLDERHYAFLLGQLVKCFEEAWLSRPISAQVFYKKVQANHCVNRRRKAIIIRKLSTYVFNQPNPRGFKVEDLYMLNICSMDGSSLAVCWSYACHPTAFPKPTFVSSDYIGVVRDEIRNNLSATDLPVVFLQGFSGNLRTVPGKKNLTWQSKFRLMLQLPVYEDIFTLGKDYIAWAKSLALVATSGLKQMKPVENISLTSRETELNLNQDFGLSSPATNRVYMQLMRLSPSLSLVAISAEVVAEFVPVIKKIWSGTEIIPVGCINTVFGYWPTVKMTKEGGYETERFMTLFDVTGKWKSNIETLFSESVMRLKKLSQ